MLLNILIQRILNEMLEKIRKKKEKIEKERLGKEQKLKEKMEFKKSLELKEIENLEKENIQLSQKFQEIQKIIIINIYFNVKIF